MIEEHKIITNKDEMLEEIKKYPFSIEYGSPELRDNEEVMSLAVQYEGQTLYFGSKKIKNNEKVALSAINQDPIAIDFVSEELKNDKNFMQKVRNLKNKNPSMDK